MAKIKYQSSPLAESLDRALDLIYSASIQQKQQEFQRQENIALYQRQRLDRLNDAQMQLDATMAAQGLLRDNIDNVADIDSTSGSSEILANQDDSIMNQSADIMTQIADAKSKYDKSLLNINQFAQGQNIKRTYDTNFDGVVTDDEMQDLNNNDIHSNLLKNPMVQKGFDFISPQDYSQRRTDYKARVEKEGVQAEDALTYVGNLNLDGTFDPLSQLTQMTKRVYTLGKDSGHDYLTGLVVPDENYADMTPGIFSYHDIDHIQGSLQDLAFDDLYELRANSKLKISDTEINEYRDSDGEKVSPKIQEWVDEWIKAFNAGLNQNKNYIVKDPHTFENYKRGITKIVSENRVAFNAEMAGITQIVNTTIGSLEDKSNVAAMYENYEKFSGKPKWVKLKGKNDFLGRLKNFLSKAQNIDLLFEMFDDESKKYLFMAAAGEDAEIVINTLRNVHKRAEEMYKNTEPWKAETVYRKNLTNFDDLLGD